METSDKNWGLNYFNYYTEIEEAFQRARGTSLFLLSSLDWALIDTWKESGIPLEAVLRGIDVSFEKWRAKKRRGRMINGLAWCTQAITEEAEKMAGAETGQPARKEVEAPFSLDELRNHLRLAAEKIAAPDLADVRAALETLLAEAETHYQNLESLEQRLSALEDKMLAVARARQSDEDLFRARADLDAQLRPYRGKMTAPQLSMLEKQFLDRWLFERLDLPRLSLFYLR